MSAWKRRGFQRGEEGEKRKEKTKKERRATVNSNHLIADPAAAL